MRKLHLFTLLLLSSAISVWGSATRHSIVVSIPDQQLILFENGAPVVSYPVSTSRFGVGDRPGSYATPLGALVVARKIGGNAPSGAVFKGRRFTGEVLRPNARGRDPIVTRILWLRGRERRNRNAFRRAIYIHGTPQERVIGRPASYGCVRMRSRDVISLYRKISVGAEVAIVNKPLRKLMPLLANHRLRRHITG
jgi:lipoprotein-anchoring transpeptidase ErfK/SrfK